MRGRITVILGALLAGALVPSAASADVHKDDDLGYSVSTPNGWKRIPLPMDEKYIVAKYLCDRSYSDKEGMSHTPEMRVVFFPPVREKKPEVEAKEGEDGTTTITINQNKTYKDFLEYLRDNAYGGYYVSKEEEVTINGIKATWMEMKFEKLTTPRRGLAVVFHREVGADYAVQFEVLEDQWEKLSRDLFSSVRTFKFTKAKKDLTGGTATGGESDPDVEIKIRDGGDGEVTIEKDSPEALRKKRDARYQKELEHIRASLPKGWKEVKSPNFVAFTHVDDKYTKRVLDQAEAVRAWLEKNFQDIGEGLPGPVILRICESVEEENSYRSATQGSGWTRGVSMTTHKDLSAGSQSMEFQNVNQMVMRFWVGEKNPELSWASPMWVQRGMDQYVMTAVLKGGRLEFKPDPWENEKLRESSRNGKIVVPKDMVESSMEEYFEIENDLAQSGAFVRFLLDGPGAKDKRTRGKFIQYLRALGDFVKEREEADKKDGNSPEKEAETEEEEEEQFRRRQEEWKTRQKELLHEVSSRSFALDDKEWAMVERLWRAYAE